MTGLNWRRGLTRLWVVLAVPWMAVSGFYFGDDAAEAWEVYASTATIDVEQRPCDTTGSAIADENCQLKNLLATQTLHSRTMARRELMAAGRWVLLPPLALALFGMLLAWVARGFRPRRDQG